MTATNPNRRYLRILIVTTVYSSVLVGSLWAAYQLRFDFHIPAVDWKYFPRHLLHVVPIQLAFLLFVGQCAGLLSYFSLPDLRRLFCGLAIPSAALFTWGYFDNSNRLPSDCVLLSQFVLAFGGLCTSRLFFRVARERLLSPGGKRRQQCRRIGIIGAGDVGAALVRDLLSKRGLGMYPVAFFDDNKNKWRSRVHNVPVLGGPEMLADPRFSLYMDEVVIAMPSASAKRMKEVVTLLQRGNRRFTTVPSLDQLASGKVRASRLRPVEIEDLLGREPITLDKTNIEECLQDKVVLVTGAGGSIGSELCRQIALFNPGKLLLLDQSEVQLFLIEQELIERGYARLISPLVGDIVDEFRMRQIFQEYAPDVVFHAAAHKHVPLMEEQPAEAIKNNTMGTALLARLAQEYGVERFVMISTDKAINPTSVMGATKRLAELYVQSLHASAPERTRFMAVRFGNVLGSSGSVIPTFKRQIAAGGPVKVTHPDMTRYFMTIPEAVSLVLQSGALGSGGEIFVLDMGKPIKILDLAKQLIELCGLKAGEDIEIEYVGLRPGEKLYEELQHEGENLAPTNHPKILRFISEPLPLSWLCDQFSQMQSCLHVSKPGHLKTIMQGIVPEYKPFLKSVTEAPDRLQEIASRQTRTAKQPRCLVEVPA
ncbi:MAG: polysaccharide biosynthesis protein [Verrucomicrobia bacterium]|nr:polysaccharide biosynthesis protein [Verrucomicrobiota bacterium]